MNKFRLLALGTVCTLLLLLTACGTSATAVKPQPTVVISKSFQTQLSPIPSPATYRCGAWSSDNTPSTSSTITIYARITKDLKPVSGATATAVAHFQNFDQQLDQNPASDSGGYVTFSLSLQGHQPANVPATVDVTFTNFPGGTLHCSPAFFTPT
ncbi:MAG TPA: hypothetical protein VJ761_23260 [Ktedonobacteraceae bacterium]|nr:hypothetical protein [Ktedonobacteraceae bacterium]